MICRAEEQNVTKNYQKVWFLLLILSVFYGFITNFIFSHLPINSGTVFIDCVLLLLFIYNFFFYKSFNVISKFNIIFFGIYVVFYCLAMIFTHSLNFLGILGLRNNVFYFIPLFIVKLEKKDIDKLVVFFISLAFISSCFSVFQFFFVRFLPQSLLSLRGEISFYYYEYNLLRVNGLYGNTIIYSLFLLTGIALQFPRLLKKVTPINVIVFVVLFLANIYTITRASELGVIGILVLEIFIYEPHRLIKSFSIFFVSLFVIFFTYITLSPTDAFVNRLSGDQNSTQISTKLHVEQIDQASSALKSSLFWGIGSGSQGGSNKNNNSKNYKNIQQENGETVNASHKIISDGGWLGLLLESGLLSFIGFVLFLVNILYHLFLEILDKRADTPVYVACCFTVLAYSCFANFINSGFWGRGNLLNISILLACSFISMQRDNVYTVVKYQD